MSTTVTTWSYVSRDPSRAGHVTQLCYNLTHSSISVSPQLTTWSLSLWPEARIHRIVTGTTPNMRWVLTNQNAFLLTRHVRGSWSVCCESWVTVRCQRFTPRWPGLRCPVCVVNTGRLWRDTLALLLLWACLDSVHSRSCSSFFCRKPHRVSGLNGVDPGSPLFLTPYLEKGAIDEGITPIILQTAVLCFFYNGHMSHRADVFSLCLQPGSWVWWESFQGPTSRVTQATSPSTRSTTATSSSGSSLHLW